MSYIPKENLGQGGGGRGPEGTLVWSWNRTDLSQFDADGLTPNFASGGGSPSLSVVSVSERGNVIRYTPSGGANVVEIFLATMPIPFPDTRRDFFVEIEAYDDTNAGGSYWGAAIMCDEEETNFHGFVHQGAINAEWQRLINDGTVASDGGTGGGSSDASFFRFQVRGEKPASAAPIFTSWQDVRDGNNVNILGRARRTGSSLAVRGNLSPFGNNTTLAATWDDLDCDRFGLGFVATPPTGVDILDMRVYLVDP